MPTYGELFAGIGGMSLGLERAGWTPRWFAENDAYCSRVLAKHWPTVPNLGDVTAIDWENDGLDHGDGIARSLHVDLVCGGFPCQPVSRAGRQLAQADARWLWPEFARCLRGVRPRYAIVENVPGLLVHGMGDVLGDLAGLGFDAEWESLPAAAFGAPHLRDRVFLVAWAEHGWALADAGSGRGPGDDVRAGRDAVRSGRSDVADANGSRFSERRRPIAVPTQNGSAECGGEDLADTNSASTQSERRPSLPLFRPASLERPKRRSSGGNAWSVEPDVGRVAHGIPARVDRLRGLGNAVVPQVAEWIGRQLLAVLPAYEEHENAERARD